MNKKLKYYKFLLDCNLKQQKLLKDDERMLRKKIKEEKEYEDKN